LFKNLKFELFWRALDVSQNILIKSEKKKKKKKKNEGEGEEEEEKRN